MKSIKMPNKKEKTIKNKKTFSLNNINFVKQSPKFICVSLAIIFVGILVLCIWGFNLGIDFTGGTVISVETGTIDNATYNNHVNEIKDVLTTNSLKVATVQTQGEGAESKILVRFQDKSGADEAEMTTILADVKTQVATKLSIDAEKVLISDRIAASASATLLLNAFLAILVAVILMLIYIAIRFELLSGISAIIALMHDVFVMTSLVLILRIQINSAFIAALITIIGYSINNTIIIFDRIRENKKSSEFATFTHTEIANKSINQSLTRTINTTITTFVAIAVLAIIGVPSIREFVLPIIFGLIAGVSSSLFIAPTIWAVVNDKTEPRRKALPKTLEVVELNEKEFEVEE